MAKASKDDILNEMDRLIDSLSREKKHTHAENLRKIRKDLTQLFSEIDDEVYYQLVNESLREDWENEKDDAYNEL
ncbi:hypothetical protein [Siminovitchia sp. 179-K 8D1 HS]|uniref:hypothetical protein n=1 Tax=Siminovitchia sp. 179-K 8D1 HS TaxID=3142385 RepID=UPI0039A054E0